MDTRNVLSALSPECGRGWTPNSFVSKCSRRLSTASASVLLQGLSPAYFGIRLQEGADALGRLLGDVGAGLSSISNTTLRILPLNGNGAS